MESQELTKEQLQIQVKSQYQIIKGLQQEIGVLTGDRVALSITCQQLQEEMEKLQPEKKEKELNKNAKKQ